MWWSPENFAVLWLLRQSWRVAAGDFISTKEEYEQWACVYIKQACRTMMYRAILHGVLHVFIFWLGCLWKSFSNSCTVCLINMKQCIHMTLAYTFMAGKLVSIIFFLTHLSPILQKHSLYLVSFLNFYPISQFQCGAYASLFPRCRTQAGTLFVYLYLCICMC